MPQSYTLSISRSIEHFLLSLSSIPWCPWSSMVYEPAQLVPRCCKASAAVQRMSWLRRLKRCGRALASTSFTSNVHQSTCFIMLPYFYMLLYLNCVCFWTCSIAQHSHPAPFWFPESLATGRDKILLPGPRIRPPVDTELFRLEWHRSKILRISLVSLIYIYIYSYDLLLEIFWFSFWFVILRFFRILSDSPLASAFCPAGTSAATEL